MSFKQFYEATSGGKGPSLTTFNPKKVFVLADKLTAGNPIDVNRYFLSFLKQFDSNTKTVNSFKQIYNTIAPLLASLKQNGIDVGFLQEPTKELVDSLKYADERLLEGEDFDVALTDLVESGAEQDFISFISCKLYDSNLLSQEVLDHLEEFHGITVDSFSDIRDIMEEEI